MITWPTVIVCTVTFSANLTIIFLRNFYLCGYKVFKQGSVICMVAEYIKENFKVQMLALSMFRVELNDATP